MASAGGVRFIAEVEQWAEAAKADTRLVVIETINDINERIIVEWPVKTGFSRASWYASLNGEVFGEPGIAPTYEMQLVASELQIGDIYRAGNVAAYALRLEKGFVGQDALGRNYNQPGLFIVERTLDDSPRIAQEAAYRVAARASGGV